MKDSSWDFDALKLEFGEILQIVQRNRFLLISGFEMGEIDVAFSRSAIDEEDELPMRSTRSRRVPSSAICGSSESIALLCGDASPPETYRRLLGEEHAQMVFTDPPWNIPDCGNVSGSARSSTKTSRSLTER